MASTVRRTSSNMTSFHVGRRDFLRACTVITAAAGLPSWVQARRADAAPMEPKATEKSGLGIALVGCGGMGSYDLSIASEFGQVVALCDVDTNRLAKLGEKYPKAVRFKDFRELVASPLVHVVINGTPDHWHTLVNLAAIQAGKDVYSEKPLTLTIDEGRRLVKAVKQYRRVLQTGSQQRSNARFQFAVELVRQGRVGTLKHITTFLPSGPHGGPFSTAPVPVGLDWDMWQGQAPAMEFVPERCHGTFRYFWEYSAGTLTDWGAHHNDIALWALGLPEDKAGPVLVQGHALRDPVPKGYSFPSTYWLNYTYANGVTHTCRTVENEGGSGQSLGREPSPGQYSNGVLLEGNDGWIFVNRSKIMASDAAILHDPGKVQADFGSANRNHFLNFFDCVRSRQNPVCHPGVGHRSVSLCHLGAIAIRLGRALRWNPASERFVEDREADSWVSRPQRKPYTYSMI
jgi:predicted dehydrogenase